MKFPFYCFLTGIALAIASPSPQAGGGLPSVPASIGPPTPSPFANAALWHEAVTNDANLGESNTTNQGFYAQVAYWQGLENSSNSIIDDYLDCAQGASRTLQFLHMYPTDFNQAQALDPATTQGRSEP